MRLEVFGQGVGALSGEVEGSLVWANFPKRRQDGVWTPNLRGCVTTVHGEEIRVSIRQVGSPTTDE